MWCDQGGLHFFHHARNTNDAFPSHKIHAIATRRMAPHTYKFMPRFSRTPVPADVNLERLAEPLDITSPAQCSEPEILDSINS